MKLTESQIQDIHQKLAIPLSNKEFIEEMVDHFVLDIEHQMQNNSISFEQAFVITKNGFGGAEGLIKMQNQYIKGFQKMIIKDLSWMSFRSLFTSPTGILWLFLVTFGCYFYDEMISWQYTPFGFIIPIAILLIIYVFQLYKGNAFRYWNEKTGSKLGLIATTHILAFQIFNIYFNLFHSILKITPAKLNFVVYGIAVWLLYMSIEQVKKEQKKYFQKV
ncbi:MAG: hypothetical protein MUC49_16715 [Raineya sp.]|jgi:hypothetical protein|nr:hypothetical protein [Raineya sp.]